MKGTEMKDTIYRDDAIKAMEQRYQDILSIFKRKVKDGEKAIALDMMGCIKSLPSADRALVGYTGVDEDYLVSVQEVLNITAETGALETQRRVRELARRDKPNAMEIMAAYHEGVRKGIAEAYEADGLQGWMTVIRDTFCSDCKGYRHDNCEYRESCYTMRVLDEVERRQHE